jgi:hypothetical protein
MSEPTPETEPEDELPNEPDEDLVAYEERSDDDYETN